MQRLSVFLRIIGIVLGIVFVLAGAMTFFLPIPIGLVLLIIGAAILVAASPQFARWLRARRANHPGVDEAIREAEERIPKPAGALVERTDPKRGSGRAGHRASHRSVDEPRAADRVADGRGPS